MEPVDRRGEELMLLVKENGVRIKRMRAGHSTAQVYAHRVIKAGFPMAAVIIYSQMLENSLRTTLRAYDLKRRAAEVLGLQDPYPKSLKTHDFSKSPLGNLIKCLKKLEGDTPLVKDLFVFNEKIRNEFIHHLFDGVKDVEKAEAEALEYISTLEIPRMEKDISELHLTIIDEIKEMYKGKL